MNIGWLAALLCAAASPAAASQEAPVTAEAAPAKTARKKPHKPETTGVLNVNRASEAELRLLPGIGKKKAQLIVERREKRLFASLEEVGRIKGMKNLVHKLHKQLAVSGDSTLRPVRP